MRSVYKHIQIPSSNVRIALERIQPEVIFKVCLEVLKKQSFFNAFILSADVPEIYMQHSNHLRIPLSNLKIALERIQTEVIFKVCLEVLKKQSFFNAFILSADVPVIYMQQFWYTVTQELSTQKFYFQLDNQVMEVNADLIRNALKINPRITDHPFTSPPPEKAIINFIDQLGCNKKFNVLSNLRINELHQP
ncbi:hypothetical protein Tco_0257151 [Tanacetum coccineum]